MHPLLKSLTKYLRGADKRQLVFVLLCLLCPESFRPICRQTRWTAALITQGPISRTSGRFLAVETRGLQFQW